MDIITAEGERITIQYPSERLSLTLKSYKHNDRLLLKCIKGDDEKIVLTSKHFSGFSPNEQEKAFHSVCELVMNMLLIGTTSDIDVKELIRTYEQTYS